MSHVHAELMLAFADNPKLPIEVYYDTVDGKEIWNNVSTPSFSQSLKYRIKSRDNAHDHSELLRMFAADPEMQFQKRDWAGDWVEVSHGMMDWGGGAEYRPVPKKRAFIIGDVLESVETSLVVVKTGDNEDFPNSFAAVVIRGDDFYKVGHKSDHFGIHFFNPKELQYD